MDLTVGVPVIGLVATSIVAVVLVVLGTVLAISAIRCEARDIWQDYLLTEIEKSNLEVTARAKVAYEKRNIIRKLVFRY